MYLMLLHTSMKALSSSSHRVAPWITVPSSLSPVSRSRSPSSQSSETGIARCVSLCSGRLSPDLPAHSRDGQLSHDLLACLPSVVQGCCATIVSRASISKPKRIPHHCMTRNMFFEEGVEERGYDVDHTSSSANRRGDVPSPDPKRRRAGVDDLTPRLASSLLSLLSRALHPPSITFPPLLLAAT